METLTLAVEDGIALLTLNRPDVLNSINTQLIADMREAVAEVSRDDKARVLLITGAGRGFCAGADLAAQGQRQEGMSIGQGVAHGMTVGFNPMMRELYALQKPIVAAVNGLAVGVGFGGAAAGLAGQSRAKAMNLALGIGLQNFPEGLAVSMPLKRAGLSSYKAFLFGQLSGVVEPVGGVLGAALVTLVTPILPYALAFAAGAMIYVVVDQLIPESLAGPSQNKQQTLAFMGGFGLMMIMDVALG